MPELPHGTVTFLFTDIEGSTAFWERDRSGMAAAVDRHLNLLRTSIESHGGAAFKIVGDAVQAAFETAPEALAAALHAQQALLSEQWSELGPLRVRMALHAGEATPDERGDYLAAPLNRLSRLLATGHGGQILLTQTVQQLVRGALIPGAEIRDLGEYRLRDLLEPERVYQIFHPDLPTEFPPLKALESRPNNLPRQPTRFLGRELEVAEIVSHLRRDDVQLLTLTGPGGGGKTRLALQAATELLEDYADGVFFVSLAPLSDPDLLTSAAASAIGLREEGRKPPLQRLKEFLADRHLLLVMDNFEHLISAAPIIGELLGAAPSLKVLATSRAPLRLRAEHEYDVPPLGLPRRDPPPTLVQLTQYEAVRLFIDRARAVKSEFTVDNENAPAIAEICHRMDGLPLAIELAAARVRMLAPQALLLRLEQRLPFLTGGARDAPERQRTLRSTIAWSHGLLEPDDQVLFRRLAIFAGGCTIAAAEAVGNPDNSLDGFSVLEQLVDHNLVRQEESSDHEPRFGMLETIREYGLEQLAKHGEAPDVRDRHAAYYLELVERLDAAVVAFLPDGQRVLNQLEAEQPNLRLALSWYAEIGNGTALLRLASALNYFWQVRGGVIEGTSWLERALALGANASPALQAAGLFGLAGMLRAQGHAAQALPLCLESLSLAREDGDLRGIALAAQRCSLLARQRGEFTEAEAFEAESLAALDDLPGEAWAARAASTVLGHVPLGRGDLAEAERQFQEAIARQQALGHEPGTSHPYACFPLIGLGDVARGRGEPVAALARYQTGLKHAWNFGEAPPIAYALGGVAGALAAAGRWELAARLFGATEALCERSGLPFGPATMDRQRALGLPEPWQRGNASCGLDDPLRAALAGQRTTLLESVPDMEGAQMHWTSGRMLSAAEAVAEALGLTAEPNR